MTQTKPSDANLDKCRPEAAGDVISGVFMGPVVLNKCVKFNEPSFNRSRKIPPEAVGGGIFDCLSSTTSDWKQINDVISGVAVDNVGMDVCVKFVDSRSNAFPDI